jgi:HEAT repeat protein
VQPPLQELDVTPPNPQAATTSQPPTLLPPTTTSRLAKVNIVDELLKDLSSPDPTKRRKAIWDLGQQGDSRAIQPLVDLMIDADSQQRSLILAALTEIGIRTLKPMNQALAMSLQHESPQVRQNAIRDLTRIYDMMAQISQMLCHAVQDPDAEVQATARYALAQMNRIRSLPSQDKPSKNSRQELKKLD